MTISLNGCNWSFRLADRLAFFGNHINSTLGKVMFYYSKNGQQIGPVSADVLRQLALGGAISPDDLVWKDAAKKTPARSVKGLFPTPPQSEESGHASGADMEDEPPPIPQQEVGADEEPPPIPIGEGVQDDEPPPIPADVTSVDDEVPPPIPNAVVNVETQSFSAEANAQSAMPVTPVAINSTNWARPKSKSISPAAIISCLAVGVCAVLAVVWVNSNKNNQIALQADVPQADRFTSNSQQKNSPYSTPPDVAKVQQELNELASSLGKPRSANPSKSGNKTGTQSIPRNVPADSTEELEDNASRVARLFQSEDDSTLNLFKGKTITVHGELIATMRRHVDDRTNTVLKLKGIQGMEVWCDLQTIVESAKDLEGKFVVVKGNIRGIETLYDGRKHVSIKECKLLSPSIPTEQMQSPDPVVTVNPDDYQALLRDSALRTRSQVVCSYLRMMRNGSVLPLSRTPDQPLAELFEKMGGEAKGNSNGSMRVSIDVRLESFLRLTMDNWVTMFGKVDFQQVEDKEFESQWNTKPIAWIIKCKDGDLTFKGIPEKNPAGTGVKTISISWLEQGDSSEAPKIVKANPNAAPSKAKKIPTTGFQNIWKGDGGKSIDLRPVHQGDRAILTFRAHNFDNRTSAGRKYAVSGLDAATKQILEQYKSIPKQRNTIEVESERQERWEDSILVRTVVFRLPQK